MRQKPEERFQTGIRTRTIKLENRTASGLAAIGPLGKDDMAKKRKMKTGNANTKEPQKTDPQPAGKRKIMGTGTVFAAGFILAFLLAWFLFSPGKNAAAKPAEAAETEIETRTLTGKELAEFLQAVDNQDFAAMSRLGKELLQTGNTIAGHDALLEKYAVDSYPPHQVYALFTRIGNPKSYRVLLTMEGNKVVSFMAEEIDIAG